MTDLKLRAALIRLLWNSVADDAECTCSPGDPCPDCEAMEALGLGRWSGAGDAARKLHEAGKAIERAGDNVPPVLDEVTHCLACPYAHDVDGVWLCEAADRDIGPVGTTDASWEKTPPAWCPLRVADRLVTLRVP